MSINLRVLCVIGSVITLYVVTSSIRHRKLRMDDSIFWAVLSATLLLIALFPRIAALCATALGFQAPSNFVFLAVIAVLLVKLFSLSAEVSTLKNRVNQLVQEEALKNNQT